MWSSTQPAHRSGADSFYFLLENITSGASNVPSRFGSGSGAELGVSVVSHTFFDAGSAVGVSSRCRLPAGSKEEVLLKGDTKVRRRTQKGAVKN